MRNSLSKGTQEHLPSLNTECEIIHNGPEKAKNLNMNQYSQQILDRCKFLCIARRIIYQYIQTTVALNKRVTRDCDCGGITLKNAITGYKNKHTASKPFLLIVIKFCVVTISIFSSMLFHNSVPIITINK